LNFRQHAALLGPIAPADGFWKRSAEAMKCRGRKMPDGTQLWAQVRGRMIINGGLNQTEKTFHPLIGLSASEVPNGIKSP
jgi:hypothetical protein